MDGDTDSTQVQNDFKNVTKEHIQFLKENSEAQQIDIPNGNAVIPNGQAIQNGFVQNGHIPHANNNNDTVLHDLEDEPVPTISKTVSRAIANGVNHMANGHLALKVPGIANSTLRNKITDLNTDRQNNIRELYGGFNTENHI